MSVKTVTASYELYEQNELLYFLSKRSPGAVAHHPLEPFCSIRKVSFCLVERVDQLIPRTTLRGGLNPTRNRLKISPAWGWQIPVFDD